MELKFEKEMVCQLSNYETNTNSNCTNFTKKHSIRNKVKSIRDDTIRHQIGNGYDDDDDDYDDNNNNNNNNNNNVVLQ